MYKKLWVLEPLGTVFVPQDEELKVVEPVLETLRNAMATDVELLVVTSHPDTLEKLQEVLESAVRSVPQGTQENPFLFWWKKQAVAAERAQVTLWSDPDLLPGHQMALSGEVQLQYPERTVGLKESDLREALQFLELIP